ncbi:hypothetical protein [Myxococcus sp. CA040A]|uniref:hypothetical protein n=1 Tax=Myxococcus sp. CA040A TaxID=2741738 RepID=UPI00157A8B14|nr:hypothetical protein [Myxococcus sp. CA040A]NTX02441.1 hypothetical protein [Myxococcus sp. CA040A]
MPSISLWTAKHLHARRTGAAGENGPESWFIRDTLPAEHTPGASAHAFGEEAEFPEMEGAAFESLTHEEAQAGMRVNTLQDLD